MLRRHHRIFQSAQVLRDTALAGAAFWLAYLVRFHTDVLPFTSPANEEETLVMGFVVLGVWPAVAWISNLYISHRTRSLVAEVFDVFKVSAIAFLVLVTITYFGREERYSRAVMILWPGFTFLLVAAVRTGMGVVLRRLRARGYNLRYVIIVGIGDLATRVLHLVEQRSAMGLRAIGLVAHDDDRELVGGHVAGHPVLGTVSQLASILDRRRLQGSAVDQVIVALPVDKLSALKEVMKILSQETVDVRLIPDVYQFVTLCGSVEEFSGLPLINLQSTPLMGWNRVAKRSFDLLVASIGLVLSLPLLAVTAPLIKLSGPGPVFFRQQRVGMDGQTFHMYKLRTMGVDAEANGAQITRERDPRRTGVGRLLRRLSLDELPQIWNVLKGDMSLVGPRPEQPAFIEEFKREIPRYALRHKIKSGMTGWAQVHGMRGNTNIEKRIEMDLYYIENWSLLLDVKILIRTVFGGFLSPNAY